jgi:hypothetical protein
VAASVLRLVPDGTRYVDVSVPGRPVAGSLDTPAVAAAPRSGTLDSQVEVDGMGSTGA